MNVSMEGIRPAGWAVAATTRRRLGTDALHLRGESKG